MAEPPSPEKIKRSCGMREKNPSGEGELFFFPWRKKKTLTPYCFSNIETLLSLPLLHQTYFFRILTPQNKWLRMLLTIGEAPWRQETPSTVFLIASKKWKTSFSWTSGRRCKYCLCRGPRLQLCWSEQSCQAVISARAAHLLQIIPCC